MRPLKPICSLRSSRYACGLWGKKPLSSTYRSSPFGNAFILVSNCLECDILVRKKKPNKGDQAIKKTSRASASDALTPRLSPSDPPSWEKEWMGYAYIAELWGLIFAIEEEIWKGCKGQSRMDCLTRHRFPYQAISDTGWTYSLVKDQAHASTWHW